MKYRKLGDNGPTVAAIGLGAGSATTDFGERAGKRYMPGYFTTLGA